MAFLQQTPIETFIKNFLDGDTLRFPTDSYENRRARAIAAYHARHKKTTYKNESIISFKEYIKGVLHD